MGVLEDVQVRKKTWQKEGKALEGNNHQRCKKSWRTVRCWNQDRRSPCCINTGCPEYSEYSSSSRTSSSPKHLDFCTITSPGPDPGRDPKWAGPLSGFQVNGAKVQTPEDGLLRRELSVKSRERERDRPVNPALGRLMQEDCQESETNLDYSVRSRPAGFRVRACLKG